MAVENLLPPFLRGFALRRRLRLLRLSIGDRTRETQRRIVLGRQASRERRELERARREAGEPTWSTPPLVSITIATWNRANILAGRTIPAILAQTHANVEVIVVGDCCTDHTAEAIAALGDERVRFVNRPERGDYPADRYRRQCVAGAIPMMQARSLASGEWIAHCDDDEVWVPEHLALLLAEARRTGAELVWGRASYEMSPGEWRLFGHRDLARLDIPHSTVLMRSYLRLYRESMTCWRLRLGADHHRFRRMHMSGVRTAFVDEVVTLGPLRPGTSAQWTNAEDKQHV